MELVLPEKKRTVAADLRRALGAEKVRDDFPTLTAYAVDASMYKIVPQAVIQAESETDIETVVEYAARTGVSVTPRAAGTNLTGSAIGSGIILDISRLNRILELNREEKWVRVQPGIVYAELNKSLAPSGLLFGPDPSSGEMCKVGGMLANNSAGPHTLQYGSVKDNVLSLKVLVESHGWLEARPYDLADPRLEDVLAGHPPLREILDLVHEHADLIRAKRPTVSKNSCGYNLFGLVDGLEQAVFDLPKLFVGSEGTLGVISEATLRLVDRPKVSATVLIHLRYLEDVGEAVVHLLTLAPSALEVMDSNTLDLIGRNQHAIPADAAATLLVEFDSPQEGDGSAKAQASRATAMCRKYRLSADPMMAFEQEQRDRLWKARKALYPTLYRYDLRKKPINYVDDVVVRAERLSELIRYLEEFFKGQQVPVAIFGHIGNGNAHIVPLLDVNDPNDFARMVEGYRDIHQTVLSRFEGSICGEHGDGRVRAEFVRRMFGEELYGLFVRVKQSLDPRGVLNPGVKISDTPFTHHIDYTRLSKACATCGKCNSVCPVYDVFQSEDMSSRGWFEIVTSKDYSYLNSKRVVEACLNCKSCRTICPADVDVSDLILKRRAEHPNRMAGIIFALHARAQVFEPFLKIAARTQPFWDRPRPRAWLEWLARPLMRRIADTARLPREMILPRLATRHLRDRYPELTENGRTEKKTGTAYFHGCAANYFDDGVGDAVIAVLRRLGIEPALPPQRCSGTPIQTYGHLKLVMESARYNLASLEPYDTVVTGCASCTLMLKDYPRLFEAGPEREAAERLARRVRHISELVAESKQATTREGVAPRATRKVTYHSSCHLRAAGVTKAPRQVLAGLPGVEYVEMQDADRCAGGAGTYILKDYDTAMKIFERKQRAIESSGADVVATSCPACMIQLNNGLRGKVRVKHVAELLREACETESDLKDERPSSKS
ncbi:MAG: FAD-binding oxidoreductase [Nitrospirae bacterium]|nr:FAD-binding oxidoreductase [Nitrospirota bacterium]